MVLLLSKKDPVFPLSHWVLNKGTTGTMFLSFGMTRSWSEIEPGTLINPALETSTLLLGYQGGYYWKQNKNTSQ